MPQLTSTQLEQLRTEVLQGDFIQYYNLLSQFGDPYGTLAHQVVTNESGSGSVARAYAQTFSSTALDWFGISTSLMVADFDEREAAFISGEDSINLSVDIIRTYHSSVFAEFNLPPEAWTAYTPSVLAGPGGEDALWDEFLAHDGWFGQMLFSSSAALSQVLIPALSDDFASFVLTQIGGFNPFTLLTTFTIVEINIPEANLADDWVARIFNPDVVAAAFSGAPNPGFRISTGSGGEFVGGTEGDDVVLTGTAGDDIIIGYRGADQINAGAGSDHVYAGKGDDIIFGAAGNDVLHGGDGNVQLWQDDGLDTVDYSAAPQPIAVDLHQVNDLEVIEISVTDDGFDGQDYLFSIERIVGSKNSDRFNLLEAIPTDPLLKIDGGENQGTSDFSIQHYVDAENTVTILSTDMDILSLEGLAKPNSSLRIDLGADGTTLKSVEGAVFYESDPTETLTIQNFEGVLGTDGIDKIFGTNGNNAIFGFNEDVGSEGESSPNGDLLVGRGGEDLLVGDDGNDKLYGGFWWDSPGSPAPENYADDGARDILLGGGDFDTYYVSQNDQIWDMTLDQMEIAVPGGPNGMMTLASDGNGTVFFNGLQLTQAVWIEAGEDKANGGYERQDWVNYDGAGFTLDVFKDETTGFVYRVFETVAYVGEFGNTEVRFYTLGVEDWNTETVFEIGNAVYDPDTHTLGFPTQGGTQSVSTSNLVASTTASVQTLTFSVDDRFSGLIEAVGASGDVASFNSGLSVALIPLTLSTSDVGAPGPSAGPQDSSAPANGPGDDNPIATRYGSGALSRETAETTTVATAEASSSVGSYLGITFYEPDPIDGTTGDDNVTLTNGDDTYDAGAGNDTVKGRNGNDALYGGSGNDLLDGGGGDDILDGGTGSDTLKGGTGSDTADYGTLNEAVRADLANGYARNIGQFLLWVDDFTSIENLAGSTYSDVLIGDSGDNVLTGRAGHDQLIGNGGTDVFDGGLGQDTVYFDWVTSGSVATIDLEAGTFGGAAAGNTYISIESFYGTNIAGSGDTILGDDNKNYFFGVAGNDILDGRGGGDVLVGGAGADTLTGGSGVDWFLYQSFADSGTISGTWDVITDFTVGEDLIDLSFMDADILTSGSQKFIFIGTNAFGNVAGELRYEQIGGSTFLEADNDGDGVAEFSVELTGLHDLGFADFGAGSLKLEFYGTAGDDTITATPGNDLIAAGFGNDTIYAGAGDDFLFGNGGDDQLFGEAGDDYLAGDDAPDSMGADLLDGGEGTDEASYYGALAGVVASLANPSLNTNEAAGDTYVSIENLRGSLFDDDLYGDDGANAIWGEDGNDSIEGGGGADQIDGGDGFDYAIYRSSPTGVVASLVAGGSAGDAAGDTYVSIEALEGSAFDDTLIGDGTNNNFVGNDGADHFDGGSGGRDLVWYGDATAAISIDFSQNLGLTGEAAGDSFANIDSIQGTNFDDYLIGGGTVPELFGGNGDDTFVLTTSGKLIVGEAGSDTIDLSNSTEPVHANLFRTEPYDFYGQIFQLNWVWFETSQAYSYLDRIENIIGTNFDDVLEGTDGDNYLNGGSGFDELWGRSGTDVLVSGPGDDMVVGGNGSDTVDYTDSWAGVDLTFTATTPFVYFGNTLSANYAIIGGVETDYLFELENARGSAFDDALEGSGGSNAFYGLAGADTLDGKGGNDVLEGGTGDDDLWGGSGFDSFRFALGDGVDTIHDFADGADSIQFSGGIVFTDLTIADEAGGARVTYSVSDSILVSNVAAANLTEGDFVFV